MKSMRYFLAFWATLLLNRSIIPVSTSFSFSRLFSESDRRRETVWRPSLSRKSTTSALTTDRTSGPLFFIDPRSSDATIPPSSAPLSSNFAAEWTQTISRNDRYEEALSELFQGWKDLNKDSQQSALALLFVSPPWAEELDRITVKTQEMLGPQTQLITVVGGGIVGGGEELEDSTVPCMSFFGGILPAESSIDIESFVNGQKGENERACKAQNPNSYLVFADPYSTNVDKVLEECNRPSKATSRLNDESDSTISSSIVAGAVSVASHKHQATLAVGTNVLPPGSLIRASFFGNLGLQVVVSQGCRPVGPTYRVTRVNGPAVLELDSMRAIDQLQETIERDCNAQDKEYLQTKGMTRGVLGGIYREQDNTNDELSMSVPKDKATFVESRTKEPQHFVVRQMTGFQPKSGGIVICGRPQVKAGDFFRFHVRSPAGALEDWSKIMKRAKTERVFLGSRAGEPIGALQFSCAARGEALFEERNVDLHHVQDLIQKSTHEDEGYSSNTQKMPPPVAGFFANAEISAVGNSIRMGASTDGISSQQKSFVHGYATVVAVLCDYSRAKTEQCDQSPYPSAESSEIEAIGIMDSKSTSVWA